MKSRRLLGQAISIVRGMKRCLARHAGGGAGSGAADQGRRGDVPERRRQPAICHGRARIRGPLSRQQSAADVFRKRICRHHRPRGRRAAREPNRYSRCPASGQGTIARSTSRRTPDANRSDHPRFRPDRCRTSDRPGHRGGAGGRPAQDHDYGRRGCGAGCAWRRGRSGSTSPSGWNCPKGPNSART